MYKRISNNKIIKNISQLLSSSVCASLLGLINTSILVNSIGLQQNGLLFLAQSYASFFNSLFNFQCFDAIIKFLPGNMGDDNEKGKNYIMLGIILDTFTAIVAFVVAILLVKYVGLYLKWNNDMVYYSFISSFSIIFTVTGAFNGIYRIYNEFKKIGYINIFKAIFTMILYIIGKIYNLKVIYYIYINIFVNMISLLINIYFIYKILEENKMNKLDFKSIKIDREFIKFAISTNLTSTLDLPVFQLVPFIISKYLGFEEISVYKILEKIGGIISGVVSIISQVITPEISIRIANNDTVGAIKLSKKISVLVFFAGGILTLFFSITHNMWLDIFIPNHTIYTQSIYFYIMYVIITSAFIGQHPIFIYSGFIKHNIYILCIVNTFYLIILGYMAKYIGLVGIILSRILQAILIFTIKGFILQKHINQKLKVISM